MADFRGVPLPSIAKARLPATYIGAVDALAKCERVDECKTWSDKAAALASYAKQSRDDELEKMARRIHARAIRRCGELLDEIEEAKGANQNISSGAPTKVTRTEAAKQAGLSRDQHVTAIRVARVPKPAFEEQVESDDPPTVSALAEQGKKPVPSSSTPVFDLGGRDPNDFKAATHGLAILERFAQEIKVADVRAIFRGASARERKLVPDHIATIRRALLTWEKIFSEE